MRSYKEEYQYWLDSPALDEEEWKELSAIADDEKEIESRFYAPLEFGTAYAGPPRPLPRSSRPRAPRPVRRAWWSATTAA